MGVPHTACSWKAIFARLGHDLWRLNDPGNKTIVDNDLIISVLANDVACGAFILDSVTTTSGPSSGSTTDNADGTITYTPGPVGSTSFTYTVDNANGTSNPATVSVEVENNVAPVAVNDILSTNTAALDNAGGMLTVNVLNNDSDVNNGFDLPGGIRTNSVEVLTQPAIGTCTANADGTITYSQPGPAVAEVASCTYRITDIDSVNTPFTASASLNINVAVLQSDWPTALPANVIPLLAIVPGIPGNPSDTSVPALGGSFFTMQVQSNPDVIIYTTMNPGPAGGLVVDHEQPVGNSHTGSPNDTEQTAIELGWNFFGNTGYSFTKDGGVIGNPDGTLEFAGAGGIGVTPGRFYITWNGIPAIDLGGSAAYPEDLGFATISCDPAPCADQSAFTLAYSAHVPNGDPSGFGGVPYGLTLEGTVRFYSDQLNVSGGNIIEQSRMPASETGMTDTEVAQQCVGDCFEYTVNNVDGGVTLVLPLAGGVPLNPVWRILENGVWRSFDTSTGDSIASAPLGETATECPDPGDSAYVVGVDGKPVLGHQCIQLMIADNGPNDTDPAAGTISDPGGMGGGGVAGGGDTGVDNRGSSTSGCTIGDGSITRSSRSEWWLLAGFIAWLGWNRRRHSNRD